MTKTELRRPLDMETMIYVAAAHDGLSGKLAERAGFHAIWASGFEISASRALPDANILGMAEVLQKAREINDAVNIPVIADCDDGFGNAINVVRTVQSFEAAGIAGICIEDNAHPKRCSFYEGVSRELVSLEEFVGKIRAAKAARRSDDFLILARTEALVAGRGLEEAFRRASAYAAAGADMVVIHSKSELPSEIKQFGQNWKKACPLVAIPTTYKTVTAQELQSWGYRMVIYANQGLRAAVKALTETFDTLRREGRADAVDDNIVPLEEIFELVGVSDLRQQEELYLPTPKQPTRAIILAAGFDRGLMPLVEDRPKAMLDVKGRTILEREIDALGEGGVREIFVVRGYQRESIDYAGVRYYDNPDYETTGILHSLMCARDSFDRPFISLYSDIIFDDSVLHKALSSEVDVGLVVDLSWAEHRVSAGRRDLVVLERPPNIGVRYMDMPASIRILEIGQALDGDRAHGEFIGMGVFTRAGARALLAAYDQSVRKYGRGGPFHEAAEFRLASFTDVVQEMIEQGINVNAICIYKGWMDVDTFEDYSRAWRDVGS